ncbi:hypothetical protein V2G26_018938 [Clonostachys chloroleuca]
MKFLPAAVALVAGVASATPAPRAFHPSQYKKSFATCKAVDRGGDAPVDVNLKLAYVDINPTAQKTIVMVHGWPSLWTTYRHQIDTLGKDYRLIIVELRGFGDSEHPDDLISSNSMLDVVGDITCIMDHANVQAGICMGNDFGAQVCWSAGRARPDRFIGIFNEVVPYVPSSTEFISNEALASLAPGFGYQIFLSKDPKVAAAELDSDPRSAIRSCAQVANSTVPSDFLVDRESFLNAWYKANEEAGRDEIPFSGIMTKEVEDYMVASYQKQGFYNTFNGYQEPNRKLTWEFEHNQGNFTIRQPTFALYPTKDPVADWAAVAEQLGSAHYLTNHYTATLETAHWVHEEKPAEFDAIFREWVGNVTWPGN